MNVQSLKGAIVRDFALALPNIAEILLAKEGVGIMETQEHLVIADLMDRDHDDTISFFNVRYYFPRDMYCKMNNLNGFPMPSSPSRTQTPRAPTIATATVTEMALALGDQKNMIYNDPIQPPCSLWGPTGQPPTPRQSLLANA